MSALHYYPPMGAPEPSSQPDFRTLFHALPGAYLVLLPDPPAYTIVAASDMYLHATRTTRELVLGRSMFEVFPDPGPANDQRPGAPDLRTSFATVLRTRAPDRMADHRYDLRGPGGGREVRWWAALNTPVLDSDGEVRYILHQAEDVTDRASRNRFQHLAAVLEQITMATGHDEVLEVVRNGARRLVGADGACLFLRDSDQCYCVTADSLDGPLWSGRRFPLDGCVAGWAMRHGRIAVIEDVATDDRATPAVYEPASVRSMVMVPLGSPEPFATIGAYWGEPRHPDREEVAVLEALARVAGETIERSRVEARYRLLFDSIDAGFCVIEVLFDEAERPVDYRFLEVNQAFERQTGLLDAVGRRMRELAPEHEQIWLDNYGHVARTGERVRFEQRSGALGGRWFDVDAFRVGDPAQRRVAVLLSDVTERRRGEERLREAGRLEAVGALAGGVAHEANNQMSVVLGFADFVLRRADLPPTVREDVEQISRAAERTAQVTSQLLAFGRRQIRNPVLLDLNDVITRFAPVVHRTLGLESELVLSLAPELGHVVADARQLEQVLLNLTLNARDAMPSGGTLTIRTCNVELAAGAAPDAATDAVPPGAYVQLAVEDTGEGVDEAIRARIFEPFFTTKGVGRGTGLGLASVYGIVKQSGGFIEVERGRTGGARFVILLPRAAPGLLLESP